MEEWRWKSCIQALKDYHDTDEYIEKVTKEIRHPYRETDVNSDIKGTRTFKTECFRFVLLQSNGDVDAFKIKELKVGAL